MAYATAKNDAKLVFGINNLRKWADIDNEDDHTFIDQRYAWAETQADTYINTRLNGSMYTLPFEAPVPELIVNLAARLIGWFLYESRGITDNDPGKNELQVHMDYVNNTLKAILADRVKLSGLHNFNTAPVVFKHDT